MTVVRATVGEDVLASVKSDISCLCPPPEILPFNSLNTPAMSCFGVRNTFEGIGLIDTWFTGEQSHTPLPIQLRSSVLPAKAKGSLPYFTVASLMDMAA